MDTIKGFRDIENSSKRNSIKSVIEDTFRLYSFAPVETPIIESEEFVRGNNTNDEAVSDVFKLQDKGERKLALRYEFTFQLKRLANNKKLPYKRYQIGEVFRDEPITGNRWRQFTQCDADIVGSSAKDEAEILSLISKILTKLKIKFTVNINSRKLLNEILEDLKIKEPDKNSLIKEIDKMDKLPESEIKASLKKYNAEKILQLFKKPEKFFERYSSYKDIKELKKLASLYNVKLNFQPFLARGLSYYNGIIFEVKSEIKETIAAGGSYLVNGVQATGISFGLDRIELLSKINPDTKKILIISLDQDKESIKIAEEIRSFNIPAQVFYGKPSKALDYANSCSFPLVIFMGEEEIKNKKYKLKNMKSGREKMISYNNLKRGLTD